MDVLLWSLRRLMQLPWAVTAATGAPSGGVGMASSWGPYSTARHGVAGGNPDSSVLSYSRLQAVAPGDMHPSYNITREKRGGLVQYGEEGRIGPRTWGTSLQVCSGILAPHQLLAWAQPLAQRPITYLQPLLFVQTYLRALLPVSVLAMLPTSFSSCCLRLT